MNLFDPYESAGIRLNNRIVMAPMTRARNADNIANQQTALYYSQRATAGLIVTEGVTISQEAQAAIMVPGLWSEPQVTGWAKVVGAVHAAGGKIFAQLWHAGRMSHSSLQPGDGEPVSAGAVAVTPHPMSTAYVYLEDGAPGMTSPTPPRALTTDEVVRVVMDFADAADHAQIADFDGVELHGATGYLFEQFLNPHVNLRTDRYGGSIENRARFTLEVVDAIAARIGVDRIGIRLSPRSSLGDMPDYPEHDATYRLLARELGKRGIAYVHLHDVGYLQNDGSPLLSDDMLHTFKIAFGGALMLAGGLTKDRAMTLIQRGVIDLAAFGQPYIANPDLVERFQRDIALAAPDRATYYGGGAHGYTDYPVSAHPPR